MLIALRCWSLILFFYLANEKRKKRNENGNGKEKPWGEGKNREKQVTRAAGTFPFANFPLSKFDFGGQDKKTYFLGGQKRGKRGQKEKKIMSLNVDYRKLGQKNKR